MQKFITVRHMGSYKANGSKMRPDRNNTGYPCSTSELLKAKTLEYKLKNKVEPLLKRGRPGDYEHTLRAVAYGSLLLKHEIGQRKIVIPALYLHDIGWSKVNFMDFLRSPSFATKRQCVSLADHMEYGALMAREILEEMQYDKKLINIITSIIAIHDYPEAIFSMKNSSATIITESDRLDRYGLAGRRRVNELFQFKNHNEKQCIGIDQGLRQGLDKWFRTETARNLAMKWQKKRRRI